MASPTQWANSRGWWRTGEPGMLQAMGSQRVRLKRLNNHHQRYPAVKFWWILELLRSPPWSLLSSRWRRCVPSSVWLGPCGPREQTQEGILWNSYKGLKCASGESFVCVCVRLWFLVSPLFIQFPWFNFTSLFSLIRGTALPGLLRCRSGSRLGSFKASHEAGRALVGCCGDEVAAVRKDGQCAPTWPEVTQLPQVNICFNVLSFRVKLFLCDLCFQCTFGHHIRCHQFGDSGAGNLWVSESRSVVSNPLRPLQSMGFSRPEDWSG